MWVQKPMSPTKRDGDRKIAVFYSPSNRHSFGEAVPEGETLALFVKALQRCAGCCIERLVAGIALVTCTPRAMPLKTASNTLQYGY